MKKSVLLLGYLMVSVDAVNVRKNDITWNYQTTGNHPSVNRLPKTPPVVAKFRLGTDGPANHITGTISEPQKGLAPKVPLPPLGEDSLTQTWS